MINATSALSISKNNKWLLDLIQTRIYEAAMKGEQETFIGNDFDRENKEYGPEMKAYYGGNYQSITNVEMTENIYADILKSHGYDVDWCQSCLTIKW